MIAAPFLHALAALTATAVAEPVAVAPWRNLNAAAELEWLTQGAAETMAADLRAAGLRVVERAAIARALAELEARPPIPGTDEVSRAVAAGRLVGARSIVLGSFQANGAEVRLVARFVDVETGVVQETAKATGSVDGIFKLQDQIVAALASRAGKAPKAPARRSGTRAYEKFSTSLVAKDDDARRALLEEALRLDPTLTYAVAALDALEARLRAGRAASDVAFAEREAELLVIVEDAAAPKERRIAAARALLDELEAARRFRTLLRASERVRAARVPRDVLDDVDERSSAARCIALARLVRVDEALQAGEKHLGAFPAGARRADVEKVVRELVEERRTEPERRREYDEELAENEEDRREAERDGKLAERVVSLDFKPCIAAKWSRLPDEMLARCEAFLARHGRSADPDARTHTRSARAYVAWAHAMRGRFERARSSADALEQDDPGSLDDMGLRAVMARWPTD